MRFIEDQGSSFTKETRLSEDDMGEQGNNFAWAIVIVVLLGLNISSWAFCNMVFGHPEHPFSYRLLTKLEKLEPLKGFKTTTVPPGKFLTPKDFYGRVYPFSKSDLRAYNALLKRNFLWIYNEKDPAYFIYGSFTVKGVRTLVPEEDMFPMGIVVTAEAHRFPDAKVELILPTKTPVLEANQYKIGDTLKIDRSTMAASVLHVVREKDKPIIMSAVPLVTKDSSSENRRFKTSSNETLILETPQWLNIH